jgi:hypothetical protein
MSSSRSVAAARARRSAPEPAQSFKPGPITSINSSTSFNPGSSRLPQNMQQSQQQPQEPVHGGKRTVTNVIALMSLRIGRLEDFAYQYNLDKTNNELNGYQSQTETSGQVDSSIIKNIITRLELMEKDKKLQSTTQQKHIATPITNTPTTNTHTIDSVDIDKFNQEIKSLQDELKETKDLLMKLQSFTMDTNQKLVNIMFHDTNELDVDQIEKSQDFEYSEAYKNDNLQILEELQPLFQSQTISGNLKDFINAELAISDV